MLTSDLFENKTPAAWRAGYERGLRYYRQGPDNPYPAGSEEAKDYADGYHNGELDSYDKYDTSTMNEGSLNEFAPGGGGDDDIGDDPYKYPEPKRYGRSVNFFGQFEADHFDREDMNDATGEFKGYWNYDGKPKQIAYFKFDDPAKTGGDDSGMGWYYEPQSNSRSDNVSAKPAVDNFKKLKQQELDMIRAFLKSGNRPSPGSQIYQLMKKHGIEEGQDNSYGYQVGQTVKLQDGSQGQVLDIFDDSIEVLLVGGRTVTVDFRDAQVISEQGVAEGFFDMFKDKTEPAEATDEMKQQALTLLPKIKRAVELELFDEQLNGLELLEKIFLPLGKGFYKTNLGKQKFNVYYHTVNFTGDDPTDQKKSIQAIDQFEYYLENPQGVAEGSDDVASATPAKNERGRFTAWDDDEPMRLKCEDGEFRTIQEINMLRQKIGMKPFSIKSQQGMAEAIDPNRNKAQRMIYKYFGQIYDYGDDDGLDYLDKQGDLWNQLMDKYNGEIDDIVAREPTAVLIQAAQELKGIAGDMKYELDEQGVAEAAGSEEQMAEQTLQKLISFARDNPETTMAQLASSPLKNRVTAALSACDLLIRSYTNAKQLGNAEFVRQLKQEINYFLTDKSSSSDLLTFGDLLMGKLGKINFQQDMAEENLTEQDLAEAVSTLELADFLFKGLEQKFPKIIERYGHEVVGNAIMDVAEENLDVSSVSEVDMLIDDIIEKLQNYNGNDSGLRESTVSRLYYNVVGTSAPELRKDFGMRHDRRGWFLSESSGRNRIMDAQRAFGSPKLVEYSVSDATGGAAQLGPDNVIGPVGSVPKSQRINTKKARK
jgi:hypothetical protein